MKNIIISALIFLSYCGVAYAQIGPGNQCGLSSGTPCYVTGSGGGGSTAVNQGAQAGTAAGNTWFVDPYVGGAEVSVSNPFAVQPGTGSVFPISASSLPLPSGASTDASLTDVQSAPGTPQTTSVTVQGNASGVPVPVSGTVSATQSGTWNIGSISTLPNITVSSSVLPTGASTSANQTSVQSSPGTPQTTAETIQGNAGGVPVPVTVSSGSSTITTKPGTFTEVALDVATTTSANTAVTALIATHRSAGGWIENPITATTVICVNTITTAAFSSGACVGSNNGIAPGQVFNIPANANAVSVVSSDASHAFSGEGLQ